MTGIKLYYFCIILQGNKIFCLGALKSVATPPRTREYFQQILFRNSGVGMDNFYRTVELETVSDELK